MRKKNIRLTQAQIDAVLFALAIVNGIGDNEDGSEYDLDKVMSLRMKQARMALEKESEVVYRENKLSAPISNDVLISYYSGAFPASYSSVG